MHEPDRNLEIYHNMVFSYEKEKQKNIFAYFLLVTAIFIFVITLTGVTNGISDWTSEYLTEHLGYTNKWSKTYGPPWFVHVMNDLSALGGKVILFIASLLVIGYYRIRKRYRMIWKFLFVIVGGSFILLGIKLIHAVEVPYEPTEILISNVASFPSGHAMMGMIFYFTIGVFITRRQRRSKLRSFTLISASIIIFLISVSRVLGAAHTVTEVLAGLSAGLIWLCICWIAERYLKLNYKWDF